MREVCKIGLLQQKDTTPKSFLAAKVGSKKIVYLPEKLYVLCVHDDRIPFLELYAGDKDIPSHVPQKVVDLLNCSYVSRVVEDERTFVVGFDHPDKKPLELTALSSQERQDWMNMLTFNLTRLGCLPPVDNTYGPLPLKNNNSYALNNVDNAVFGTNPVLGLVSPLQNTLLHDHLSSQTSNGNSVPNDEETYEAIGHATSSRIDHRPDVRPKPVSGNSRRSSETSQRSNFAPPLPPRTKNLVVNVEDRNSLESNGHDEEGHYSIAPVYASYRRHLSSESNYDQPSPPLPCSPPRVPSAPHPKEHEASNEILGHFYDNDIEDKGVRLMSNSDGRYADVVYPPRPYNADRGRRNKAFNISSGIKNDQSVLDHRQFEIVNEETRNSLGEPSQKTSVDDDDDDGMVVVPIAPLSPPPSIPEGRSSSQYSPPPVPPRNDFSREFMKVKQVEVIKLKSEMDAEPGVRVKVSMEAAIKGLALVEFNGNIWVSGWNVKYNKALSVGFHVGDKLIEIDKHPVPSTIDETRRLLNVLAFAGPVEILLKRLPHGKAFYLERDIEGKKLGLIRKNGKKNEIVDVEHRSIAEKCGITKKTFSYLNPSAPVNWFITEVNGRPISFFAKNNEAGERLAAVGLEISIVVQPVDFVKMLKKCLKQQKKNYKDFIIG